MAPSVTAIVLNYRSPRDCVACVQGLLKQTIKEEMDIMIVDNHSDDESVAMLRARFAKEPRVRILESAENTGFGRGNMIGTAQAHGDYLLIINPDNVLPVNGLEKLRDILTADSSIGIVGPALVYPSGDIRPSARRLPRIRDLFLKRFSSGRWMKQHRKTVGSADLQDVDWVVGACFLIPKTLFETLNGFDPRFFLFFEDTDLCRRCLLAGKRVVYAPSVRVADRRERLSDGGLAGMLLKKTGRIHLLSAAKYYWKWRGSP